MTTITDAPGRRYDPTLNDGRGGWIDPPRPWLNDPAVARARKAMDTAEAAYQAAYDQWVEVVRQVHELSLRATSGPTLVPSDFSTIVETGAAGDAKAQAKRLDESDQLAALEARNVKHRVFLDARDRYHREVAAARRRHGPIPAPAR